MLLTRGIVLRYYPYSESSIIVKIFTENFGLQSYIMKGLWSKTSAIKIAVFQPLTLIEFIAYHKENKSVHHLKEPRVVYHYQSIPIDANKRSIFIFISELLYKTIREEIPDKALFEWIYNSLTWFDMSEVNNLNYHLVFLIQLSRFLGFYPKYDPHLPTRFFDLQEGRFCENQPTHPQYIGGGGVSQIIELYKSTFENSSSVHLTTIERRHVLDKLILYYQMHLPGFGEMKSIEVLKSVSE